MIIRTALKTGFASGIVLYLKGLGVWGNSKQSEKIYNDITSLVKPYAVQAKQKLPFTVPPLPKKGEIRFLAKYYYNNGVKGTFKFVHMLPCYAGQLIGKVKSGINKAIDAPSK